MLFSDAWNENIALFETFLKIHLNPPIIYYGFNQLSVQRNGRKSVQWNGLTVFEISSMDHTYFEVVDDGWHHVEY